MNIEELRNLGAWVADEIHGRRIPDLYRALYDAVNATAGGNRQPFENQKNELYNALRAIDLSKLTIDQMRLLDKAGLAPYIGNRGADLIEDILVKNPLDLQTTASKLKTNLKELTEATGKLVVFKDALANLVDAAPSAPEGQIVVRVGFTGDASMKNVVDFKNWAGEWHDIARGIALAHGSPPEDVRVVGATTGSIVMELATAYSIALTVSGILLLSLGVAHKIILVKQEAEKLRGMKLINDKIAKQLDDEAIKIKETEADAVTKQIAEVLKAQAKLDGEQMNALSQSVKKLISFLEKGGEVDCVVPTGENQQNESPELLELRASAAKVRQLEDQVKKLGYVKPGGAA
jgi:hypothetical protein